MIIRKSLALVIMVYLFIPVHSVFADQCDDAYDRARGIHDAARESLNQKDLKRAEDQYLEASRYYEETAAMQNCRCPKIPGIAREYANSCKDMAAKCRESENKNAAERKAYEDYNRAKEKYNQGISFAENREWDKAISAFEQAASMWDRVASDYPQNENGKNALKSARLARNSLAVTLDYRNKR
jgi:hypothetical protein